MKTFYIEGYGCSLNMGETESTSGFLKSHGFSRVLTPQDADYIIINTCSVKMVTEQRMLSRIEKLMEFKKEDSKIIVSGCLGATNPDEIKKINEDLIVVDTKLENICEAIGLNAHSFSPRIVPDKENKNISIIPISVGCLSNCTYCATKLARSKLESYPIKEINSAFKRAIRNSKEILITSQDLGCYGLDKGTNLVELIKTLLKNEGDYRIRLGMLSPEHFMKFKEEFMKLYSDKRLYKFLHLPVQSGSNFVLKEMKRLYTVEEFKELVSFARSKVPGISIATDIIVGFPGETDDDFNKTLDLLKEVKPEIVNIARYGKRKGTKAAIMENQISEAVKKERSRIVSSLCKNQRLNKNKKFLDRKMDVLIINKNSNNEYLGRNDYYIPVQLEGDGECFVKAKVYEVSPNFLKAKILA